MKNKLELRGVSWGYATEQGYLQVLDQLNIRVGAGEFVSLLGPSGCGKSTVLNLIWGLERLREGQIRINDQCPDQPGRFLAHMPQKDLLFPWRRLLDNVILGLEIEGVPRREAVARARELLPLFGLEGFERSYPSQLSGGMRQRAALLRTILPHKDILLLDEPFGALDAITRFQMQSWLLGIWEKFRYSVLFVTHDIEEALYLSDRVYVLSSRPGQVKEEIRVSLPRPRKPAFTAEALFMEMKSRILEALEAKG